MKKTALLLIVILANALLGQRVYAHTFFEGLVDISINPGNGHIEVVHQYTTHDLTTMLAERYQKAINADSAEFERLLKQYVEGHFKLMRNSNPIKLTWVGVDAGVNVTRIYQEYTENEAKLSLSGIQVQCNMLTDFFPRQINRVNYQDQQLKGTLIFKAGSKMQLIR